VRDDGGGEARCECHEGYAGPVCDLCRVGFQDHDGDDRCLPDCSAAALDCELRQRCDDGSGVAACTCFPGYDGTACADCATGHQDHDGDGFCLPDCAASGLACGGHGLCDDAGGLASCRCDPGFQDHDVDGECLPDCPNVGRECDPREVCDDADGWASCRCAPGFQDHDLDGECLPDCAAAALDCGDHEARDDSLGVAACRCTRGRAGAECAECADGFSRTGVDCIPDRAWTFAVYLAGDNDLEPAALDDLDEMMLVGSSDDVAVVVLLDTWTGGTEALVVERGRTTRIEDWGERDMGDWRTLRDFGLLVVEHFPARRTALVLWDHGDGWKSTAGGEGAPRDTKSYAHDSHGGGDGISIAAGDHAAALRPVVAALGRRLDLVGFDACLMGTWEVADATAPFADLLVASSEDVPADGWPYRAVLRELRAAPATTPAALARGLVDAYHDASPLALVLAAVDLADADGLAAAVTDLADALAAAPLATTDVETVRRATLGFSDRDARDLGDFAERIAALPGAAADVVAAAAALLVALDTAVVHVRVQPSHAAAHGLSVYFPAAFAGTDPRYLAPGATWAARSTWDEFILSFAGPW
jgi:hypothetical protein